MDNEPLAHKVHSNLQSILVFAIDTWDVCILLLKLIILERICILHTHQGEPHVFHGGREGQEGGEKGNVGGVSECCEVKGVEGGW